MGVERHVAVTASHALLMALVTKTGSDSACPYQRNDHVERDFAPAERHQNDNEKWRDNERYQQCYRGIESDLHVAALAEPAFKRDMKRI